MRYKSRISDYGKAKAKERPTPPWWCIVWPCGRQCRLWIKQSNQLFVVIIFSATSGNIFVSVAAESANSTSYVCWRISLCEILMIKQSVDKQNRPLPRLPPTFHVICGSMHPSSTTIHLAPQTLLDLVIFNSRNVWLKNPVDGWVMFSLRGVSLLTLTILLIEWATTCVHACNLIL